MSDKNKVEQRIRLDGKEYSRELRRIREEQTKTTGWVSKELQTAGSSYRDYTNLVKKQSAGLMTALAEVGRSFGRNLGRGAMLGGAATGVSFLHTQMKQTVATSLDFGRAFANLASRADLSQARIRKLREEFYKLGAAGANLDSLPGAVQQLLGGTNGNLDQAMSAMGPIAKAAAMGDGDSETVAKYVKEILKSEGRSLNGSNVESLLGSAVSATRGGDFSSVNDFLGARLSGTSGVNGRSGVGDRQFAAMMSGASRAGLDKESGLSAINALVRASVKELGGDQMLGGFLGVGSLRGKNGGFDIDKLGQAAGNIKKRGLNDNQLVEVLQGVGLSEQESSGLVSILKNIKTFQAGVKRVADDQKTLDQAFTESTDNLSDKLKKLRQNIIGGFGRLTAPLEGTAGKATDALVGMAGNPAALIAGGLLTTAAGGKLAKSVMGSFGGAAGVAGGIAKGKALEQAGIQSVYVVNASEFGAGGGVGDLAAGAAGAGAGGAGKLAKLAGMGRFLGLGAVAAGTGYAASEVATGIVEPGGAGRAAKAVGLDSLAETMDRLEKAFSDWSGRLVGMHSDVKVEVHSKDPAYVARPKATDNPRDSRGF